MNTKLYTGNGSTNAISGIGFQPDLVWIKNRVTTGNQTWFNSISGATKYVSSNTTYSEATSAPTLTSFDSDGFTLGSSADLNGSGNAICSWNWKAGTTGSGSTTGAGTDKAYSYSVNVAGGFSITKYLGNGTSGHQIPHNLGVAPSMVIVKRLDNTRHWCVGHASEGWTKAGFLSATDSWDSAYDYWDNTDPTSSVVQLSNSVAVNSGDENYIMYAFANKRGYLKCGGYLGNGSTNGQFVFTGHAPKFLMMKRVDGGGDKWRLWDNQRSTFNVVDDSLAPNESSVEYDDVSVSLDFLSNGFKMRTSSGGAGNGSGERHIYLSIGQSLVGDNGIPNNAR